MFARGVRSWGNTTWLGQSKLDDNIIVIVLHSLRNTSATRTTFLNHPSGQLLCTYAYPVPYPEDTWNTQIR